MLAHLVCLGTHTVTGLLNTCGRQFQDWSADYRLYEKARIVPEQLFEPVRQWLCENQQGPIVTAMDDTRLRKTGTKIHGVKYMRDPLGPPFQVNLIRAQRFVQTSMACKGQHGAARMIPVDWCHAPVPPKAKEKNKAQEQEDSIMPLSDVGVERIGHLRAWLDAHGAKERALWTVVDGSYTNRTVLKKLPQRTTLVGRIRGDAKLYHLPARQSGKGRRRVYGQLAPTPEQLRQDENTPWQKIEVFFGGDIRTLRVKSLGPLRWRTAGKNHDLQLIVLAPTPYRLSKNSKLLYRQPAYLICTDPNAPIIEVVQHYLWRWDIEVNHRDEKTILGIGEAQVRTKKAVQNVTGTAVAAYAMLLIAAVQCQKKNQDWEQLPAPKWYPQKVARPTTRMLINNLRYELWACAIHFSGFITKAQANKKPQKLSTALNSAIFYAARFA